MEMEGIKTMELIELYVKEVGQRLPEKMRLDIQNELRSMIEDTLEDEARKQGKQPDEAMVEEVLKRLGSPTKMADSYLPPKYLIGPALYPYFINTMRVVLPIIAVLTILGLGISLGASARLPQEVAGAIGQAALGLFDTVFHTLGIIVLVFAIIQWTSPDLKIAQKAWDPRKLKAVPDVERVRPAGQIAQIILAVFAIVVLNLYPQWIGISNYHDGQWFHAPLMTDAFFRYVPLISLQIALSAVLHMVLFSQGRWTAATRWASIFLNAFSIAIAYLLLTGPALVSLDPAAIASLGLNITDSAAIQLSSRLTNDALRVALGISIAAQVIEIGKALYRLLLKDRLSTVLDSR